MPLQQFSPAQYALLRNLFLQSGGVAFDDLADALKELIRVSVVRTTADLLLDSTHDVVLADSTSNNVTVTLPLIADKIYEVKFLQGSNAVAVASADLVDGDASVTLYDKESITVACDGTTWSIV